MSAEPKPLALVVEDDAEIMALLEYNLAKSGFLVRSAGDGEQALLLADEQTPDIVLLDWMLPAMSGLEVCRRMRRTPRLRRTAIILLTARGEEADRLRGLKSGADDHVTKPFSPAELVARMRRVLRRAEPDPTDGVLEFADVVMDLAAYRVRRCGRDVYLAPTEFRLLRHFLANPRQVFTREQLLDAVWGSDVLIEPRTVDVHIRRLRKAMNETAEVDLIRTVRSAGYALDRGACDGSS